MNTEEILRRLRCLIAIPKAERPISVSELERVAGVYGGSAWIAVRDSAMTEKTRLRFERALTLLENDQIKHKPPPPTPRKHANLIVKKKGELYIGPPKPQQVNVTHVSFKSGKPKLRFVALNPKAFPDMEPKE